jgi:hypothetical protein
LSATGDADDERRTEVNMYENALLRYVGADKESWRESLMRAEVMADR